MKLDSNSMSGVSSPQGMHGIDSNMSSFLVYLIESIGVPFFRLYKEKNYLEIEWTAGPLPDDGHGRELVLMYNTSINSGAEFWTDSNGRAMIRRVRNKRLSWDSKLADNIAGNFYPITSAIYIADKTHVFSVITDRAQGAASLGPGHIEIMLHRRTIVDDKRGVGEKLNETFCKGENCQGMLLIVVSCMLIFLTA